MSEQAPRPTIAVLGGTGKEGKGLAYRWARAGYDVLIGSRLAEKASQTAAELNELLDGKATLSGLPNAEAAARAQVAVLAVPYAAHAETLESVKSALAGKLLIDVVVSLQTPKTKVQMPAAGSAAQEARAILGEATEVAAAFHTIPHEALLGNESIECEVLVTGSGKQTRAEALKLVEAAGLTGWDAGPIENSVVVEGFASVLIYLNKQYGSTHAGIRITGVNRT